MSMAHYFCLPVFQQQSVGLEPAYFHKRVSRSSFQIKPRTCLRLYDLNEKKEKYLALLGIKVCEIPELIASLPIWKQ